MFDGPQSAGTKLIWLVSWMWRDFSVIPGGQQEKYKETNSGGILLFKIVHLSKQAVTLHQANRQGRKS